MKPNWFDRGRDAMTEGRRCLITDARISEADRQDWYAGWYHQSRLNHSKLIDPSEREAAIKGIQEILNSLNDQG